MLDVLTPHVLSEWMVEVCGAYLYRVRFMFRAGERLLMFRAGVMCSGLT